MGILEIFELRAYAIRDYPQIATAFLMNTLLSKDQIEKSLERVPGWTCDGRQISATYQCKDFAGSMNFVNRVAAIAEAANHHPDIDIRWNRVTLVLSTHSAGGLTAADFRVAEEIGPAA
jgi:4a-hydroxytetrahydrobiopterin dehydratase